MGLCDRWLFYDCLKDFMVECGILNRSNVFINKNEVERKKSEQGTKDKMVLEKN